MNLLATAIDGPKWAKFICDDNSFRILLGDGGGPFNRSVNPTARVDCGRRFPINFYVVLGRYQNLPSYGEIWTVDDECVKFNLRHEKGGKLLELDWADRSFDFSIFLSSDEVEQIFNGITKFKTC